MFVALYFLFKVVAAIVGFILSFWWVFVLIWIGSAILSALSSRRDEHDELLAENNRLLSQLLDEKRRNSHWED